MVDGKAFRLSAVLIVVGFVLHVVAGLFHADGPANVHRVVFAQYAASAIWTAVHLAQFAGMAVFIAGLLVLSFALDLTGGTGRVVAQLGIVSAAVALGLYGVLQAVDGVALKQAVDTWVAAPETEKATRFATAETVRWIEWGVRSYQAFMHGLTLVLLGCAVALTARLPKALGYLMGLSGLAYIVQGWVVGTEGFPETNTFAILASYVLILVWSIWLVAVTWLTKETLGATAS